MKASITIAILILSFNAISQTSHFVGISLHSIGYSLQGGVKVENAVALIGYSKPLTSAVNPTLFFGKIGYEFNLTPRIEDGFNITPLVGISSYTFDDIIKEQTVKGIAPIYSLELGKDFYNGRIFITGNYCRIFFAGGGFKIFINNKKINIINLP
jgi:hypothetical protein